MQREITQHHNGNRTYKLPKEAMLVSKKNTKNCNQPHRLYTIHQFSYQINTILKRLHIHTNPPMSWSIQSILLLLGATQSPPMQILSINTTLFIAL